MGNQIVNVETIEAKSRTMQVSHLHGNVVWLVYSPSGKAYYVTRLESGAVCTCPWGQHREDNLRSACSHVMAVESHIASEQGYTTKARPESSNTEHLHRITRNLGNGVKITIRKP